MYRRLLLCLLTCSSVLFFISLWQIFRGNIAGFEPLMWGFGFIFYSAFNWADMAMFTLLWMLLAGVLLKTKNPLLFWIALFSFWFVRGSAEVIYSLLQQFHPDVRPWVTYLPRHTLLGIFGPYTYPRYWVIEQTFFQAVTVVSLFFLIVVIVKLTKE